jgi:hypothetical protein
MVKGIAKAIAYSRLPRGTFALLHPMRATKLGVAMWVGRQIFGRRRGR